MHVVLRDRGVVYDHISQKRQKSEVMRIQWIATDDVTYAGGPTETFYHRDIVVIELNRRLCLRIPL